MRFNVMEKNSSSPRHPALNHALGSAGQEAILLATQTCLTLLSPCGHVAGAAVSLDLVFHLDNEPRPQRAEAPGEVSHAVQS